MQVRKHWRLCLGAFWIVYGVGRSLLDMAGYVDLIIAHVNAESPTWVAGVIGYLVSPPGWLPVALTVAGLGFIYWDVKRSPLSMLDKIPKLAKTPNANLGVFWSHHSLKEALISIDNQTNASSVRYPDPLEPNSEIRLLYVLVLFRGLVLSGKVNLHGAKPGYPQSEVNPPEVVGRCDISGTVLSDNLSLVWKGECKYSRLTVAKDDMSEIVRHINSAILNTSSNS